ncbi:DUF5615 family PIN-like protein [Ekhidna lutea]|uniref:DUF5615 family PIN-like protein n=1 Tax=Ekhidna lutea TaxID=447679 RepID=UPI000B77F595|nr:DUF5615 family PIN-like protein [Ekhidna lutea]
MKFIIDENISPQVAVIFRSHGLHAYHINEMKSNKKQRVKDDQLRSLTIHKGYIIVTKDDDFVKSFVSRKIPEKLIFVYGLEQKESLLTRMEEVIPDLTPLLEKHDFIEINAHEVRFPFAD